MTCLACGALDRYIVRGVCRSCGNATEVQPTELLVAL